MNEIRDNVIYLYRLVKVEDFEYSERDYYIGDEQVFSAAEGVVMSRKEMRDIMKRCDAEIGVATDEKCLKEFHKAIDSFKKRCNDDLEWSIRDYREDLWSKGKKESVDYLRKAKSKWVNRVVKSGFAGGCDEFLDTYYNCVGGVYSLKDEVLLARYYHKNMEWITDEVMDDFLINMSMVEAVQISIDDLLEDDEHKLSEITEFKPYEVLDLVGKLTEFEAMDSVIVRGKWVKLMVRSNELLRKSNGRIFGCFYTNKRGEGYNKMFVIGVVGLMHLSGIYKGELTAMSRALEGKGLEVKSIEHYLHDMMKRVRVTKESMEIINEVIEGREGGL